MTDLKFNKYVFVITGMSYIVDSSGTSKSVKAHQNIFNKKGIGFISVFPITKTFQKGLFKFEYISGCYALVVNGQFIKVCTPYEILNFLKELQKKDVHCIGIIIHHVLRNKTKDVLDLVNSIQRVPIVFYIHDFYTCCVCPQLLKNLSESCGEKYLECNGCCFKKSNKAHLIRINYLLKAIESRTTFVAPANYTLDRWLKFYPQYKTSSIVIEHLKSSGIYNGNLKTLNECDKIKIAFVGAQKEIKGWDKFKELVAELRKVSSEYCFYYFGNGHDRIDGINTVFVDSNSQGEDALTNALRKHNIDVVLFVCVCGETYSYTMYESHAANCYLIGRISGGNIPDNIIRNKWGETYNTEKDLYNYMLQNNNLKLNINSFRERMKNKIPLTYIDNDQILELFDLSTNGVIIKNNLKNTFYNRIKAIVLYRLFLILRIRK